MFCKWCGNTIKTTDKKCSSCGRETPPLSDCGGFYDLKRPWEAPTPPPEPTPSYMSAPTGPDPRVRQLMDEKQQIQEDANKRHLIMLIICGVLALLLTVSLILHIVGGDDDAPAPTVPPAGNSQAEPTGETESVPAGTSAPTDPTDETVPEETYRELKASIYDKGKKLHVGDGYEVVEVDAGENSLKAVISWEVEQKAEEENATVNAETSTEDEPTNTNGSSDGDGPSSGNGQTYEPEEETPQETVTVTEKVSLTVDWDDGIKVSCDASGLTVFAEQEDTTPVDPEPAENGEGEQNENDGTPENHQKPEPTYTYVWQYADKWDAEEWTDIATKDAGILTWAECTEGSVENEAWLRLFVTVKNGEETVLELVLDGFQLKVKEKDADEREYSVEFPVKEKNLKNDESEDQATENEADTKSNEQTEL